MKSSKYNGYDVHLVESVEEFAIIKKLCTKKVDSGVDTETSGLDHYKDSMAGVCISCGHGYLPGQYHGFYIPLRHVGYSKNLPINATMELVMWIVDNFKTVWWNRGFDFTMLEKDGCILPCCGNTHDAQCMAHLVKGDPYPALKDFAHDYLKMQVIHFSDNNAEDNNFQRTDPTVTYIYAAQDPIITVLTGRKLWAEYPHIRKVYPIDNKFSECMRRVMYSTDLYLDHAIVKTKLEENAREMASIKQQIFSYTGYQFRLTSARDIADALSRYVTLTVKTKKGQWDTSKEVLNDLHHPLADLILKFKKLEKFRGTYLAKMDIFPQPFHINYQHCNVACLTRENMVRTTNAIKSIAEVVEGDYVLSENGFYPVTGVGSFEDDTVRITLRNGAFIQGNLKHPVLTSDGRWTKLGELRLGQRVVMCRTCHITDSEVWLPEIEWGNARKKWSFSNKLDVELAQIIGFLDGDRSLVEDGIKLCFSKFEPEVEEYYIHLFSSRLNMAIPKRFEGKDNTIQYKFCSTALSKWFKHIGVKAHGQEQGVDISDWPSECQFAYVAALFDTDGTLVSQRKSDKFNLKLSLTSKAAVANVATILRFHGIDVHETTLVKGRKQPLYDLRVRSFTKYGRFKDCVVKYMRCIHKVDRLNRVKFCYEHPYNRWAGKEDSVEVIDIQNTGKQTVYDIVVGEEHTFIANGVVTHNTGRLSSGSAKGNSYFAPFNIQNVPKVEIFRYLHYTPKSAQLYYTLDDSPYTCLPGHLKIMMHDSSLVELSSIKPGMQVMTNKGVKDVIDCGKLDTPILPMEGVRTSPNWDYHDPVDGEKYFLDLGDDVYSVTTDIGQVQVRCLCQIKTKGGMRDCFICPPGYVWVSADYSSQEMVLMANFSNEKNLIEPLLAGEDIHKFVGTKMFGHYDKSHRTVAKTINFACPTDECLVHTEYGLIRPSKLTGKVLNQYAESCGLIRNQAFQGEAIRVQYDNGCVESYHVDHKVQVITKEGRVWKKVSELTKEDEVLYCPDLIRSELGEWVEYESDYLKHRKSTKTYDFCSEPFAYLMGLYLGDGCITGTEKSMTMTWVVNRDCESLFLDSCRRLSLNVKMSRESESWRVYSLNNNAFIKAVRSHFGAKKDKHLADKALQEWSHNEAKYFIAGLIDSDGDASANNVCFVNTNLTLINSVAPLINACGIPTHLSECKSSVPFWRLWLADTSQIPIQTSYRRGPKCKWSCERFTSHIITDEAVSKIKGDRYITSHYDNVIRGKSPIYPTDFDIREAQGTLNVLTTKPMKIEPIGEQTCYCIEVEGHEYLTAVVSHNSNYGASGYTIGKRLGKTTEEGQALLDRYNATMASLYRWKQEMIREGRRKGLVFTYFGRPRAVWMYYQSSDSSKHAFADRTCMNSPVQGTGGDIIRLDYIKYQSMIDPRSPKYDKEFDEKTRHALTVHDEINLFVKPEYVPQAFQKLKDIMEMKFPNWKVPLKVSPSVGVDWGHQIELLGFDENGVPIPDCDEDISLLGEA